MHLFKTPKAYLGTVLTVIVSVLLMALAIGLLGSTSRMTTNEQTQALQRALNNAVVSCYAIEGRYPATLEKIQKDYGIVIDEDKYMVTYDAFADNLMPIITVAVKGEN